MKHNNNNHNANIRNMNNRNYKQAAHPRDPRKEQKSFSHLLNVPLRHGEMTVMGAESAEDSMTHSMRLADEIRKSGIGVLVINCGFSSRRFNEHFNQYYQASFTHPRLVVYTSVRGNLAAEREQIESYISEGNIGAVILVGWEWASDSRKRKDRLYTFLREMMEYREIALVVYANSMHELRAGRMDHGGLGKLTVLAYAVGRIEGTQDLEEIAPRRKPIVVEPSEYMAATRGVHELMRKINELPRERGDDGREDEGGEYATAA